MRMKEQDLEIATGLSRPCGSNDDAYCELQFRPATNRSLCLTGRSVIYRSSSMCGRISRLVQRRPAPLIDGVLDPCGLA
jgi:hypothetical protein